MDWVTLFWVAVGWVLAYGIVIAWGAFAARRRDEGFRTSLMQWADEYDDLAAELERHAEQQGREVDVQWLRMKAKQLRTEAGQS